MSFSQGRSLQGRGLRLSLALLGSRGRSNPLSPPLGARLGPSALPTPQPCSAATPLQLSCPASPPCPGASLLERPPSLPHRCSRSLSAPAACSRVSGLSTYRTPHSPGLIRVGTCELPVGCMPASLSSSRGCSEATFGIRQSEPECCLYSICAMWAQGQVP